MAGVDFVDAPAGVRAVERWADLDGPVRYLDFGGPADGPLLVGVHGLGGSAENWLALGPLLTDRYRVLALDLAGFGLTRGAGRRTTVTANADLAASFTERVGGGPAIWLGNSMGGLICLLAATRRPDLVRGLALLNPALLPSLTGGLNPLTAGLFTAYLAPGVGRAVIAGRRRIRTPEQSAQDSLRFCCADAGRVPSDVVRAHVQMVERRTPYAGLEREFVSATRSLIRMLTRPRRLTELSDAVQAPVLLVHGDQDRLVPISAAVATARRHPRWTFAVARGAGHLPQLEMPEWTAARLTGWLDGALPAT